MSMDHNQVHTGFEKSSKIPRIISDQCVVRPTCHGVFDLSPNMAKPTIAGSRGSANHCGNFSYSVFHLDTL